MENKNLISTWLFLCLISVFSMVFVGGLTRITHSGLSITEWKPIVGFLPPFNEKDWNDEFEKYKQIPEFKLINNNINLTGFKKIYFLEYFHRLLGRITFFLCIIPLFLFFLLKKINKAFFLKMLSIFSLIGIQGLIGWFMVKSGLVVRTSVNEYWLAFHLCFALLIFSLIFIQFLKVFFNYENSIFASTKENKFLFFVTFILTPIQIFFGGLVAGIRIINFCYKNSHDICNFSFSKTIAFQNEMPVFYFHKLIAFFLFFSIVYIAFFSFKKNFETILSLCLFLITQIIFGILIIFLPQSFSYTNYFAIMHQMNGFIIEAILIYLFFVQNIRSLEVNKNTS
jgi:cytochrome c oxidase assembly protein subunit 15